ncbi:hypothetical protein HMPREF0650_2291 [Hoylesella buccalis ATCC 35310]|uniref:Uncharacterized protein n=1 Tax=Hoylesella buccalis ATCC 35310 TaxID=679190 RepID=D1W2L3_9BACT|nr:hypothetical protein HMPREF0650_2291 [Hoylesella buccalis ATCC 35310]
MYIAHYQDIVYDEHFLSATNSMLLTGKSIGFARSSLSLFSSKTLLCATKLYAFGSPRCKNRPLKG